MERTQFLNLCCAVAAAPSVSSGMRSVAGVMIPDSAVAKEATGIALASEPKEIYNHSLRTFLFAELIARAKGLAHDVEAVYVAAILHDTGLARAHMSSDQRFEVDGANLARALLARHGIDGLRADLIWDAVTLHDQGGIARWKAPEVVLVNAGVAADFGAYLDIMRRNDVISILQSAPRHGFIPVFLEAVAEVARRKPQATGNCFVTDVGLRMVPGFHLNNFCDEVQRDPFAGYT